MISAPRASSARSFLGRAALLLGVVACIAALPALAAKPAKSVTASSVEIPLGTGSCGIATVDGLVGPAINIQNPPPGWNTQVGGADFYAAMYEAGNPNKNNAIVLSDLFLRYDRANEVAYILVLARNGFTVNQTDAWVKFYTVAQSTIGFNQFAWVKNAAGQTIGYEASFHLPPAGIASAGVHVQISGQGGRTSSTGMAPQYRTISLIPPTCTPTPRAFGLGNRVWHEMDNTPGYTPGTDQPLVGVPVDVYGYDPDGDVVLDTDGTPKVFGRSTTDAKGCYLVQGLAAGSYFARIAKASIPDGLRSVAIDGAASAALAGSDEITDDTARAGVTDENGQPLGQDQNGLQYTADGAYWMTGDIDTNTYVLSAQAALPTGEQTGLAAAYRCDLPPGLNDADVNSTADFALENVPPPLYGIGNLIWIEKNGITGFQAFGDQAVSGVTVNVYGLNADGTETFAKSDSSDENGCYLVDSLPEGTYVVRIPQSEFAASRPLAGVDQGSAYSDLTGTEASPTLGVDDDTDQNGRADAAKGGVRSQPYVLSGDQPSAVLEIGATCVSKPSTLDDKRVNLTADFQFDQKVAVGNLVWVEKNNIPGYQSTGTVIDEPVMDDVKVVLHQIVSGVDTIVKNTTTKGGFYLFDRLSPGRYLVEIPASEFAAANPLDPVNPGGGLLAGYESVTGASQTATDDGDRSTGSGSGDENGLDGNPLTDGIRSAEFDLLPGSAPTSEPGRISNDVNLNSALPDNQVDLTVDFAVLKKPATPQEVKVSLGSTLWVDANWDGKQSAGEPLIPHANVNVVGPLNANGTEIDGITATKTVTTGDDGIYFASGLTPGFYRVVVPAAEMSGSGAVAVALRSYYTVPNLTLGMPLEPVAPATSPVVPTLGLATRVGDGNGDNQVDGDSNGVQAAFGADAVSALIELKAGDEPNNGELSGFDELLQPNEPAAVVAARVGRASDDGEDGNGDMTIDFGFVHQCASTCDMTGDGKVTGTRPGFSTDVCPSTYGIISTDLTVLKNAKLSDTEIIYCLGAALPNQDWATNGGPGKGKPASGDCNADGKTSANDAAWCEVLANTQK